MIKVMVSLRNVHFLKKKMVFSAIGVSTPSCLFCPRGRNKLDPFWSDSALMKIFLVSEQKYCQSVKCCRFKQNAEFTKDKRMIILHAMPISLWPMLGKEKRYFYTRYSDNNDLWNL